MRCDILLRDYQIIRERRIGEKREATQDATQCNARPTMEQNKGNAMQCQTHRRVRMGGMKKSLLTNRQGSGGSSKSGNPSDPGRKWASRWWAGRRHRRLPGVVVATTATGGTRETRLGSTPAPVMGGV